MPPRKRTSQSKQTPPISPTTSTSHAPADQHHHLRHTGPSISTRSRVSAAPSKPPPVPAQPEPTSETPHTPKKQLAEVSPSGARTPFTKFMYVLLFLVLLLFGWYIYGMVTLLERLKDDVGWWGIVVSDSEAETLKGWGFTSDRSGGAKVAKGGGDLEGSLNALADALGISPTEVASAVKSLIPQASLTSIASKAEGTGGSEAVRILFEDTTRNDREGIMEEGKGIVEEGDAI